MRFENGAMSEEKTWEINIFPIKSHMREKFNKNLSFINRNIYRDFMKNVSLEKNSSAMEIWVFITFLEKYVQLSLR